MMFNTLAALAALSSVRAYWLMSVGVTTTERVDPIMTPGQVASHVHSAIGGSNFRLTTNTSFLRQSECTSTPIEEDKSAYWYPHLYFQWANGSFTSVSGGPVIYYLYDPDQGYEAFPDDFRMISGNPTRRTYDAESRAVTHLCLDFEGQTTNHNGLPLKFCPSGVRAQINYPSCWNGKDTDSEDHVSHVAYLSEGADRGSCTDPNFPVRLPRIFLEVYWDTGSFKDVYDQAMNTTQPFVYAYGDRTGYGYHADFINGWQPGVLENAIENCHCDIYGGAQCCADQGIFTLKEGGYPACRITKQIDEEVEGTFDALPGNNPVVEEGQDATPQKEENPPDLIEPVFGYTGDEAPQQGQVVEGSGKAAADAPGSSPPSASSGSDSSTNTGTSFFSTGGSSSSNTSSDTTSGAQGSCSEKRATHAKRMHRARGHALSF